MPQDPQGQEPTWVRLQRAMQKGIFPRTSASREFMTHLQDLGGDMGGFAGGAVVAAGAMGEGLANITLQTGRAANWLGYAYNAAVQGKLPEGKIPKEYDLGIPETIQKALPEEYALKLESRLAQSPKVMGVSTREPLNFLGELPAYLGGKGIAKAFSLPGKAIGLFGKPGYKMGQWITRNVPEATAWTKLAKDLLPAMIGESTGFGLYGFLAKEGNYGERAAHAMWNSLAGMAIGVGREVGRAAEVGLLKASASEVQKANWRRVLDELERGEVNFPLWKQVAPKATNLAIESMGFAGIQEDFFANLAAGIGGDEEAMKKAIATYAISFVGQLAGRGLEPTTARRNMPDVAREASWESIMAGEAKLRERMRREKGEVAVPGQEPQGRDRSMLPEGPQGQDPSMRAMQPAAAPRRLLHDPLFDVGWDAVPAKAEGGDFTMSFPGGATVSLDAQSGMLKVPADVFRAVRGDVELPEGSAEVRMEGEVAKEFLQDLATLSNLRKMRGEAAGISESQDGNQHAIGLNGEHVQRLGWSGDWQKGEPLAAKETPNQEVADDPNFNRWADLAMVLRETVPNQQGLFELEASVELLRRADLESDSMRQLADLLLTPWDPNGQIPNADILAQQLTPENIGPVGNIIGRVAGGGLGAEAARAELAAVLQASQAQPPTEGGETAAGPKPAEESQQTGSVAISGAADWPNQPPEARRAAAAEFVKAAAGEGREITAGLLRDVFAIPRETARDILGREGEAGFVAPGTLLKVPAEAAKAIGRVAEEGYDFVIRDAAKSIARRGGEEVARKITNVLSRTRALAGSVKEPLRKGEAGLKERRASLSEAVDVGGYEQPRWLANLRGKAPVAEGDEGAVDTMQRTMQARGEAFQEAGGLIYGRKPPKEGKPQKGSEFRQPTAADLSRFQPVYNYDPKAGYGILMDRSDAREAYFEQIAKLNPDLGKTGAELEGEHQKRQSGPKVSTPGERTPMEEEPSYENIPTTFEHEGTTYQVLETDPLVAIQRLLERQLPRIATIAEVGQDMSAAERERLGIADDRAGVSGLVKNFENDQRVMRMVELMQGRDPALGNRGLQVAREAVALPRAFGAWLSGIYDFGAAVEEPMVEMGFRRMLEAARDYGKAIVEGKGLSKVQEAIEIAELAGSLHHELGNLDIGMAATPLGKAAELISVPSNTIERLKTVLFDRFAVRVLRDWKVGRLRIGDQDLPDFLGLTPEEGAQLLNATASPELMRKFRHQLVQRMTSRGRMAERSRFAGSRVWTALFRYTGFATKRIEKLAEEVANFVKTWGHPKDAKWQSGANWAARGRAARRLAYRLIGMQFTGLLSQFAAYMLLDGIFRQDPVGGAVRLVRELEAFPGKTLGRAMVSAALSGPFGIMWQGMSDPERIARVDEVGGLALSIQEAVARSEGPFDFIYRLAEGVGFVPRQLRTIATSIQLQVVGGKELSDIGRRIWQWEDLKGRQHTFGTRTKSPEYYKAMEKVGRIAKAHQDGDLWEKIEPEIRKALDLEPEETVAAKLRSMQMLTGLSDLDREDLADFLGEEDMRKVLDHDTRLLQLAREAGKLEGKDATPWEDAVQMAERQARLGSSNAWRDLMDRAVESKAREMETGEPGLDMWPLAEAMARQRESIGKESAWGMKDAYEMVSEKDHLQLVRDIHSKLTIRAIRRHQDKQRREVEEEVFKK